MGTLFRRPFYHFDEQASVAAGNQPSVEKKQTNSFEGITEPDRETPIAMLPDPLNPWPNVREPGNLSKLVLEHSRVIICMRVVPERMEVCKVESRQRTETKGTTMECGRLEKERNAEVVIRQIVEHLSPVADFGWEGMLKVAAHCSEMVGKFPW